MNPSGRRNRRRKGKSMSMKRQSLLRRWILLAVMAGALAVRQPASASDHYTHLSQFGSLGSGNGQFNAPTGLAVDGYENIFVVDNTNLNLQRFDRYGNYLSQFPVSGTLVQASKVAAVDLSGNIFVSDDSNNSVDKYDNNGRKLLSITAAASGTAFKGPSGIAVDADGNVFVADIINNRVVKFDNFGNFLTQFGSTGSGDGQFNAP